MSEEVTEVRGTLEEVLPEGGLVLVTVTDDEGATRSAAGDFRSTARAIEESGLRPGDRVVIGILSWGGLAYLGPEAED